MNDEWRDDDVILARGTVVWYPTDFHKKDRVKEARIKKAHKRRNTYLTTQSTIFAELLGVSFFLSRDEAIEQAKKLRIAKIASLEREIKRDAANLARLASMVIE